MKALQGSLAVLFFLQKTQYFLTIVKHWIGFSVFYCALSFSGSLALGQDRCADIYPHQWATELITQPLQSYRNERFIEDLTHDQVIGLLERPLGSFDFIRGRNHPIGPFLIHNLHQFPSFFRTVIQDLFALSIRESWVNRGADQLLQSRFEELADIQVKTPHEVREFYEKDPVLFAELLRSEQVEVRQQGVEVAQFVVEFQDGSLLVSRVKTDYLVGSVYDVQMILEPFVGRLSDKPIKALHFLHTHPANFPGSAAALSYADIRSLEQVRLDFLHLLPGQNIETIDFHLYAIARSQRQLFVGHYSERGWGFE